jgi:DNA polymerase-3 subunit alpha
LTFGGIINDVQHRIAKTEKAGEYLQNMTKAMSLRSLEEYLKFHFFIQNNFTYMKVLVKEGWVNQDTGKK